jgi:hypothetical protein
MTTANNGTLSNMLTETVCEKVIRDKFGADLEKAAKERKERKEYLKR